MSEDPRERRHGSRRTLLEGAAAAVLLVGLAVSTFEALYVRIFSFDRQKMGAFHESLASRGLDGFHPLLDAVRLSTKPGERIALWVPQQGWNEGYGRAFHRASFHLYDRKMLPLTLPSGRRNRQTLKEAEWLVAWRGAPVVEGFAPVWSSPEGVFYRKLR